MCYRDVLLFLLLFFFRLLLLPVLSLLLLPLLLFFLLFLLLPVFLLIFWFTFLDFGYWCYYLHTPRDSLSSKNRNFYFNVHWTTIGVGNKEFQSSQNVLSLFVIKFSDLILFSKSSRLVYYINQTRSLMQLYDYLYFPKQNIISVSKYLCRQKPMFQ